MKLSIIIPVYNGGKYIEGCIKNILQQSYSDFEVIIVNDGSSDGTKMICEKIKNYYKKIKIINKERKGVSSARNCGIEAATGELISFIDCDDKLDNDMYKIMVNKMEDKNLDLIMCSYISEFNLYNSYSRFPWSDKYLNKNEILNELMPKMISKIDCYGSYNEVIMGSVWRCVFRRKIINENNLKFNEELDFAEDLIFLMKYLSQCSRVYTTNKCLYFYNRRTNLQYSTTQQYMKNLESNLNLVDKEILKIINNREFADGKIWALKKVTNLYSLVINIAHRKNNINLLKKLKNINLVVQRSEYKKYLELLDKNELYGLKKSVLICIRYKLYIFIILYFGSIRNIKCKIIN